MRQNRISVLMVRILISIVRISFAMVHILTSMVRIWISQLAVGSFPSKKPPARGFSHSYQ